MSRAVGVDVLADRRVGGGNDEDRAGKPEDRGNAPADCSKRESRRVIHRSVANAQTNQKGEPAGRLAHASPSRLYRTGCQRL